ERDRCIDLALAPDHDVFEHRSEAAAHPLAGLLADCKAERERNIAAGHEMPARVGEGRPGAALAAVDAGGALDVERAILERGGRGAPCAVDPASADASPACAPR